jgi:hypothetical protein
MTILMYGSKFTISRPERRQGQRSADGRTIIAPAYSVSDMVIEDLISKQQADKSESGSRQT